MRGKTKVDAHRWDSMRSFARNLERQHGLRCRAQDCAGTFRRSAWELLSAAMECFGAISWEAVRRQGRISALPRDLSQDLGRGRRPHAGEVRAGQVRGLLRERTPLPRQ